MIRLLVSLVLAGVFFTTSSKINAQANVSIECPDGLTQQECKIASEAAIRAVLIDRLEKNKLRIEKQLIKLKGGAANAPQISAAKAPQEFNKEANNGRSAKQLAAGSGATVRQSMPSATNSSESTGASSNENDTEGGKPKGGGDGGSSCDDQLDPKCRLDGLGFGLGLGFTYDLGDNDRIARASLVNGIVRVEQEKNVTGRFLLESHYFFTPPGKLFGLEQGRWGIGPFVAVQAGSDPIIEAMGGGLMIGFKRGKSDDSKKASFNIGIGVIYDFDERILADGIQANMPLPEGEDAIRFLETEQAGLLLMSSYAF